MDDNNNDHDHDTNHGYSCNKFDYNPINYDTININSNTYIYANGTITANVVSVKNLNSTYITSSNLYSINLASNLLNVNVATFGSNVTFKSSNVKIFDSNNN